MSVRRKHEIACPICGDTDVAKALMAPRIGGTKQLKKVETMEVLAKEARQALGKLRDHVEESCDYVGREFADEARKIHYGDVESRSIYGEATKDEAEDLNEEGVEVGVIPWLPRSDS